MKPPVKVLFASCSRDLIPTVVEHLKSIYPEIPLEVVSEFPPPFGHWTPYHVSRGFRENLARCRARFQDKHIRIAAVVLQPRMPYWRLRVLAFVLAPFNFLAFNEDFGHFMLRPRSLPVIARHILWRIRTFLVREFSPGGSIYTFLWRLIHPWAFRRPLMMMAARAAGFFTSILKPTSPRNQPAVLGGYPEGISVIIPSRDGQDLLARVLPQVIADAPSEIIVVDNGSTDATADFLARDYPGRHLGIERRAIVFRSRRERRPSQSAILPRLLPQQRHDPRSWLLRAHCTPPSIASPVSSAPPPKSFSRKANAARKPVRP